MDKKTRNQIRKSEKNGLKFKEITDKKELIKFYELLRDLYKRKHLLSPSYEEIERCFNSKLHKFFSVYDDIDMVSGGYIFYFKDKMFLSMVATEEDCYYLYPNNFLYWKLIEWGVNNGIKYFNLSGYDVGGCKATYNISKFKEGFGEVTYYNIYTTSLLYFLAYHIYKKYFNLRLDFFDFIAKFKKKNQFLYMENMNET